MDVRNGNRLFNGVLEVNEIVHQCCGCSCDVCKKEHQTGLHHSEQCLERFLNEFSLYYKQSCGDCERNDANKAEAECGKPPASEGTML